MAAPKSYRLSAFRTASKDKLYPEGADYFWSSAFYAPDEDMRVDVCSEYKILWYVKEGGYTLFKHKETGEYLEVPHRIVLNPPSVVVTPKTKGEVIVEVPIMRGTPRMD